MLTILLIGEKNSSNLGDGVIFNIVKDFTISNFNCEIVDFDLSCKEKITSKFVRFNSASMLKKQIVYYRSLIIKRLQKGKKTAISDSTFINMAHFKSKFESIVSSNAIDAIVFAGGQLFNYTFIDRLCHIIETAHKSNIPVFFNACGFGNYIDDYLFGKIINLLEMDNVKYISVRDGALLQKKLPDFFKIAQDSALLCSNQIKIKNNATEKLGIGIMLSKNQSVYTQYKFWKRTLRYLLDNDIEFQIFTNGDSYDKAFVLFLIKKFNISLNSENVCFPQSPTELIRVINRYNRIISMRLHSLIIAYSYHIPAVAIAWDKKVVEFYIKNGNDKYCIDYSMKPFHIVELLKQATDDNTYFVKYNSLISESQNNLILLIEKIMNNM